MSLKKVYFKTKIFEIKYFLKTVKKFYYKPVFALFDLFFSLTYFFINPYRISRKFLEKKLKENCYVYGETPYVTMDKIAKQTDLKESDLFLELGSGRGKSSFFIAFFYKCKIEAVEWILTFKKIANFFKTVLKVKNLKFIHNDMFNMNFEKYDVIYLYGSTLEENEILKLIDKFKKMKKTSKIITISYSLSDYDKYFFTKKSFNVYFAYGRTTAYINQIRS